MFKLSSRWLSGAVFALPLAFLTFALAQAQTVVPPATPVAPATDCVTCHVAVQEVWAHSAHGTTKAGEPITCQTCHTTVSTAHPEAPIAADRAAELCSECHQDNYAEWQTSEHGQYALACVSCHTPHSTQLKAANINALCASCHGPEATTYTHTAHAAKEVDCADCHLPVAAEVTGQHPNAHRFAPTLAACTTCHTTEAHIEVITTTATLTPTLLTSALNSGQPNIVAEAPTPVSPLGYAVFAGLMGLAFGIILAPWLERGFQRVTHNTPKEVRL